MAGAPTTVRKTSHCSQFGAAANLTQIDLDSRPSSRFVVESRLPALGGDSWLQTADRAKRNEFAHIAALATAAEAINWEDDECKD